MRLKKWEELPDKMRNESVRCYYNVLYKKRNKLYIKRLFDIIISFVLLLILAPLFFVLALAIKLDSPGPIFFRQARVTQYGKIFWIFKFRTMVDNAEKIGGQITLYDDSRITRVGLAIRKLRLDEIAQLIDVFRGTMTFVGTRPEVVKYVNEYTPEMLATLLLPAGITSEASIYYRDEDILLKNSTNADLVYIEEILPKKMNYNLSSIYNFDLCYDIKLIFITAYVIFIKK